MTRMKLLAAMLTLIMLLAPTVRAGKKDGRRIEMLVDASASMASPFGNGGSDRLGAVRSAFDILARVLGEQKEKRSIAVRVFGGGSFLGDEKACTDSRLLLDWSPSDSDIGLERLLDEVSSRGASPLAAALEAVDGDLGEIREDDALVVLLDGADSCGRDAFGLLDTMQEQGLTVVILGLNLSTENREEIAAHATLKNIWDFNGLVAVLLEIFNGPAKTEGSSTRFLLGDTQVVASLRIQSTMLPGVTTLPKEKFPLSVEVPAGSLRAEFLDAGGERLGECLRIPVLPGHSISLETPPPESRAILETRSLEEGWNIRPEMEVEWKDAPPGTLRLVLQQDPAPGASWFSAFLIDGKEGRIDLPLPEKESDAVLQLRSRQGTGENVLAALKLHTAGRGISITVPKTWHSDASIPVEWKGNAAPGDFLTIVPADSPPEKLGKIQAASAGNSFDFSPVEDDCPWEIRYISGLSNMIMARARIEINDPRAGLLVPESITVGGEFRVRFFGPRDPGDIITIAREDSQEDEYLSWSPATVDPCRLDAPVSTGSYILRYLDPAGTVLAKENIEVRETPITLDAPEHAATGSRIEISWNSQRSPEDYIALAEKDAPVGRKKDFVYVSMGSPSSLAAPRKPGVYELRYISGGHILATREIRID